ncbi:MAG: hypothetical protein KF878_02810 [Planctomycetes bacterium]|nr:hypothetical protein [Planctomycetota bacterium]
MTEPTPRGHLVALPSTPLAPPLAGAWGPFLQGRLAGRAWSGELRIGRGLPGAPPEVEAVALAIPPALVNVSPFWGDVEALACDVAAFLERDLVQGLRADERPTFSLRLVLDDAATTQELLRIDTFEPDVDALQDRARTLLLGR